MEPTNRLRFVLRQDAKTAWPSSRTLRILQQQWTQEALGTTSGGMELVTNRTEWRDVPVEDE